MKKSCDETIVDFPLIQGRLRFPGDVEFIENSQGFDELIWSGIIWTNSEAVADQVEKDKDDYFTVCSI